MKQAQEIVEALLEDVIQEAGKLFLLVFGKDMPENGYYFSGVNPLADFVRSERKNPKNLDDPKQLQTYLDYFLDRGYTFVFSNGRNITVDTQGIPTFGKEAITALQDMLGLTPETVVDWNGYTAKAARVFYKQPDHVPAGNGPSTP